MNTTAPKINPDIELPPPQGDGNVTVVTPKPEAITVLEVIDRALRDPAFDKEKFDALMAWRDRERSLALLGDFNNALHVAQGAMKPVVADMTNPQTQSKYASYAQLDKKIRDHYIAAGLSVSYDTRTSPLENHVRTLAYVSYGAFTKEYHNDVPVVTTGIKGAQMMTLTHATASAHSYGKRYLLCDIFNLAVDRDDDGNAATVDSINEEQIARIQELIVESGADIQKFCDHFRIGRVEELPANRFDNAVTALKKFGRTQAKKK